MVKRPVFDQVVLSVTASPNGMFPIIRMADDYHAQISEQILALKKIQGSIIQKEV
jgi:hypothetical protein